ncbi:HD domain-containing phosphohydrolase [Massilia sp. LjRoot122]|uniref:HD domain-containing phosphohydrolase n=1 Tax=Massilia sp. LjRoot122 TaxID=3342257 RepID=UPI003ED0F051
MSGQGVILCVDDEPHILSALRRLFRSQGYEILCAGSAREGLAMMEERAVDLVISDMRMPEMDGAEFLERARTAHPDVLRMLLTGHADVAQIMGAVNRGQIYRYITKPWDDNDILLVVRHAFERRALEQEKRRLEALTQDQNQQLRELNQGLEAQVARRTAQLKTAHDELLASHEKLKRSFLTSIRVFTGMIELRDARLAGHSRRVADLARRIGQRMGMIAHETQQVFVAGLLHEIGKIGFPDTLLELPVSMMNGEQVNQYRQYPMRGQQLLMPLEDLAEAAALVRSHQERFDGEGYPDRLAGLNIPLGARILAVASDYDNLQLGILARNKLSREQAAALILDRRGTRYDPAVVAAFIEVTTGRSPAPEAPPDRALPVSALRPGMRTTRDLITRDGQLLLSADHVLTERLIGQIADFEKSGRESFTVHVRMEGEAT